MKYHIARQSSAFPHWHFWFWFRSKVLHDRKSCWFWYQLNWTISNPSFFGRISLD
jgi:hypothetical protein